MKAKVYANDVCYFFCIILFLSDRVYLPGYLGLYNPRQRQLNYATHSLDGKAICMCACVCTYCVCVAEIPFLLQQPLPFANLINQIMIPLPRLSLPLSIAAPNLLPQFAVVRHLMSFVSTCCRCCCCIFCTAHVQHTLALLVAAANAR